MENCKLKFTLKYCRNNSTDLLKQKKPTHLLTNYPKLKFSMRSFRSSLCTMPTSNYLQAGCWLCHNVRQQTCLSHTNSCSSCAVTTGPSATTTRASTKGTIIQHRIKHPRKEIPLAAKRSRSQCSSLLSPFHQRSVLCLLSRGAVVNAGKNECNAT